MEWAATLVVTVFELTGLAVLVWWARREPEKGSGTGDNPGDTDWRRRSKW